VKTWTESLNCQLTLDELNEKRDALAQAFGERDNADRKSKEESKRLKQEVKNFDAKITQLAREIRERKEIRAVEVYEVFDLEHCKSSVVRADTKETISVRTLTKSEIETLSQTAIPGMEQEDDTAGTEGDAADSAADNA